MKKAIYILILLVFSFCNLRESHKKQICFFYEGLTKNKIPVDSFAIDKIYHHNTNDTLIASRHFVLSGKQHQIKMYTSDFYAPTDGGVIFYELDSLGIIYTRSTTWYTYRRLKCNNDSINKINWVSPLLI